MEHHFILSRIDKKNIKYYLFVCLFERTISYLQDHENISTNNTIFTKK